MNTITSFVKHHQLVAFYALVFALLAASIGVISLHQRWGPHPGLAASTIRDNRQRDRRAKPG
jgi:hypothetical protein